MGFCFICWPNFISSSYSISLRLHFSYTSFWTLRTIVVILPVIMFSYWAEADLRTDSCSKLKSVFSQVRFYEIRLEIVRFCWRSNRDLLISMIFSENVGLAKKAFEISLFLVFRNFLYLTFFFQIENILVTVYDLKKVMLVIILNKVDSCIQSDSPTTSVDTESYLPSALSCFFIFSEYTLTIPCAEMV